MMRAALDIRAERGRLDAWTVATRARGGQRPTESDLSSARRALRALAAKGVKCSVKKRPRGTLNGPHWAMSEGIDYWTPAVYTDAARRVLGGIDLDPASCEEANQFVGAARYYTIADNGLVQPWKGRVWMNPPWSQSARWVAKLVDHYQAGEVVAAVTLLNAASMTSRWFAVLHSYPLCVPSFRIEFIRPGGQPSNPNSGAVFAYLGPGTALFAAEFARFGTVMRANRPEETP
jgi:hypothetical protein